MVNLSEKNAAAEKPIFPAKPQINWDRIAWEYFNAEATMGGFYRLICLAIQKADRENLARLRAGFPELVECITGKKAE
jgi:hypothetical protein